MKTPMCELLAQIKSNLTQAELNNRLQDAIETDDDVSVAFYIDAGADVTADYNYAIRLASSSKAVESARLLLMAGANPLANEREAFKTATSKGDCEMMEVLLDWLLDQYNNPEFKPDEA